MFLVKHRLLNIRDFVVLVIIKFSLSASLVDEVLNHKSTTFPVPQDHNLVSSRSNIPRTPCLQFYVLCIKSHNSLGFVFNIPLHFQGLIFHSFIILTSYFPGVQRSQVPIIPSPCVLKTLHPSISLSFPVCA